jgi:hypothetical protein
MPPRPNRTYTGRRDRKGDRVVHVIDEYGDSSKLPLRLDLANHSPTGFEWGYGGSGPAQLALAILADALADDIAVAIHQRFKFQVIARLPRSKPWILKQQDVISCVLDMLRQNGEKMK